MRITPELAVQCTVDILQQEISANKKYSHFIDFYWIIIFVNNRPYTLHYSQQQKSHCLIHSYMKPFQTNCYQNIIKVLTKCSNYFCFRPEIYLQFFYHHILFCHVEYSGFFSCWLNNLWMKILRIYTYIVDQNDWDRSCLTETSIKSICVSIDENPTLLLGRINQYFAEQKQWEKKRVVERARQSVFFEWKPWCSIGEVVQSNDGCYRILAPRNAYADWLAFFWKHLNLCRCTQNQSMW